MGATGLLDFFTLEASEYLERLDGLIAAAGTSAPPLNDFLTESRALRGAATMARQNPIAEVAAGLELLARAVRDGHVPWDTAVRGVAVSAIDDLKILVRNVRAWSPNDDARATARRDELTAAAPATRRPSLATPNAVTVLAFVATEITDIAEAMASSGGGDRAAMRAISPRLRALRGMAGLRDLPPLGDIIDTVDDQLAVSERTTGEVADGTRRIFVAAAAALRDAVPELRAGRKPTATTDAVSGFASAVDALQSAHTTRDRVVPISSLFFADAGPHVVSTASSPPTTLAQRFRLDVVAPAEHLRRIVADARRAADGPAKAPAVRALVQSLSDLQQLAESFGEHDVARSLEKLASAASTLAKETLRQLDEVGAILSDPDESTPLAERLRRVEGENAPAPRVSLSGVMATAPSQGADLHALLARGIAGLTGLDATPLSPPAVLEEELVPIDDLLYRGTAALDRAIAVRDGLRMRASPPGQDELEELYALLDLARSP